MYESVAKYLTDILYFSCVKQLIVVEIVLHRHLTFKLQFVRREVVSTHHADHMSQPEALQNWHRPPETNRDNECSDRVR